MTKIKTVLLSLIAATLLMFFCTGATAAVYADGGDLEQTTEQTEPPAESEINASDDTDITLLADKFTEYLKAKYGADYEFYYNQIIEQWGSVEAYLLSFGDKLPEEYQSGWSKFVSWLGEYSVVWAPAFAVAIVILIAVLGKKYFNKIVERIVNSKLKPVVQELNLQSKATATMLKAQRVMLGDGKNEKFTETIAAIDKAEKELGA